MDANFENDLERKRPRLRVFRGHVDLATIAELDPDPDPDRDPDPPYFRFDDYWAGRNSAMRRSARSAA